MKRSMWMAGLTSFGVAVLSGGAAVADCELSIQPAQDQWTIAHDPFLDETAQRQFDVAVVNTGDTACTGRLSFDLKGDAFGLTLAGQPGDRVAYVLVDDRGSADVTPRSGSSARKLNSHMIAVGPGERELLRFTFAASTDRLMSAGDYTQTVHFTLSEPDGVPIAERPVVLNIQVASAAVMGLKGEFQRSNGVARINLGELTSGRRDLNTSLYVLSTGGYAISIASANAGQLRQGNSQWTVSYDLAVGRTDVNLEQGDRIERPSSRWQADDYPLTLNIGDVRGRRAGEYSDVLTFTIAAI